MNRRARLTADGQSVTHRGRDGTGPLGRRRGLLLIAAGGLALAACAGPTNQGVANLGEGANSHVSTTTSPAAGSPNQLLVEWAACMRQHGDPGQADPTISADGNISVIIPTGAPQSLSGEVHGGTAPCNQYLAGASSALRDGKPITEPSQSTELKFTACMRTHGVPNYPDPTGDTTNFNGTGVDPNSPVVERASNVCEKKTDLQSIIASNQAGDIMVRSAGLPPDGGNAKPGVPTQGPGSNGGDGG